MKIIQSFWSGKKETSHEAFGWRSPVYHAMGWALSCLQLRKYYDEVELFTDKAGYDFLIGKLNLPYTKVHVVLDELNRFPADLWGLAKIKAYSLQEQPFIHVDGDVFIYAPFSAGVLEGGLIAQNLEKDTGFYTKVFTEIENTLIVKPDDFGFQSVVGETYSCNAGILGGSDIAFFRNYTADVFYLIENNDMESIPSDIIVHFNILFEQVFFYRRAQRENKKAAVVFSTVFEDSNYPEDDMGDFTGVPARAAYLHLIGPLKRNATVCELMCRRLLKDYPDDYARIISLCNEKVSMYKVFPKNMKAPVTGAGYTLVPEVKARLEILKKWKANKEEPSEKERNKSAFFLRAVRAFESVINEAIKEFRQIPWSVFAEQDSRLLDDISFVYKPGKEQRNIQLQKEKSVKIVSTTYDWTLFANEPRHMPDVDQVSREKSVYIACIPVCLFPYHKEVRLDEFECLILSRLETPRAFGALLEELESCFSEEEIAERYEDFYKLVLIKMKRLLTNKCLSVLPETP